MKRYNLKAIAENLSKYDYLAKEHDFIEVSLWNNGDGISVCIDDKIMILTFGELKAINKLTKKLLNEKN